MLVFSPCMDCKYLFKEDNNFKCSSYPNGIPKNIFFDGSSNLCRNINKDKTHLNLSVLKKINYLKKHSYKRRTDYA